ncbi:hypothetical protein RIF29_24480 [Crotalaria pallida]|uniref:PWWP domain-containing protein n=1 Tax=Crotalaria pallida TaxID=3830 RepID=A0AAN9EKL7_CROPI
MSDDDSHHHPITSDPKPDSSFRVSPNEKFHDPDTDEFRVRVCSNENVEPFDDLDNRIQKFPSSDSNSKSLLSEFDDYVAAGKRIDVDGGSVGHGFEVGDMVWGKVKSHPWWPGHIYNEAFASPSVRRSKREGHLLVAFFGDSSYGWFETEELIPFDANFAEKSRQTSSKPFVKAVEEAVDELSRRRGLGLACNCRNADNFRPTSVRGYLSVDVPDYEPGGFYSNSEIRKARSGFRPSEALAFTKRLALAPRDGEDVSIGFIKNKATAFAYRKAVYEECDDTYAQAFGMQPSRPSQAQKNTMEQPKKQPPKAPLSGPMVTAESFSGGKNTTKSAKVKDNMKKDKYLFKRRDDPSNSFPTAHRVETPDATMRYVLQKREPAVPVVPHNLDKHEDTGFISHNSATSTSDVKESLEGSKNLGRSDLSGELPLLSTVDETSQPSHQESKVSADIIHDENAKLSGPDFKPTEQGLPTIANGGNDIHQIEAKHHKISSVKKNKGLKRPADDLNSNTSATEERKKKKKKDLNIQPNSGHLEKHSTSGKSVHLSGKPVSIALAPREGFQAEQVQGDVSSRNLPPMDITDVNFELPPLLDDLLSLALDPYHGVDRKTPAVVQKFFLHFRSRVYQKSLSLAPPTENEAPEVRGTKSPLSVRASDSPDDHVRASPVVKPAKRIVRPDDPTRSGHKRGPSDRQEEIAANRMKRIKELKALAAEKATASQKTSETSQKTSEVSHKPSEARREEGRESMSQALPKLVKPDSNRKVQRPAKIVEPSMLVIKFPPHTSLPSVAELKARFARFGPIDQSGLRVFWKSLTCRVVFVHKSDALSAYKYSVSNPSIFGSADVKYYLRAFGDSAPEVFEGSKARGDNGSNEAPRLRDPTAVHGQTSTQSRQPLLQPTLQLKSILKKSAGDESGQASGNGGSSKGNPRVKFMLGGEGEESSKGEPLIMGNRNNINNASFSAMDFNSKNVVQNVTSQLPPLLPTPPLTTQFAKTPQHNFHNYVVQNVTSHPPLLPTPPLTTQFTKTPQHNLHNTEVAMAPRNTPSFINTTTIATAPTIDISQQMLSLLTRCNDVVNNLRSLFGYVPYHSL